MDALCVFIHAIEGHHLEITLSILVENVPKVSVVGILIPSHSTPPGHCQLIENRDQPPFPLGWRPCHWTSTLNAAMVNARRA